MKNICKRLGALMLILALLASLLPTVFATGGAETGKQLTEADYASANAIFDKIDAMEREPARKNAPQRDKTDEAEALVKASESYVEGSLVRNGDSFTWWTCEGIRCSYNPYMRQKRENMVAPGVPLPDGSYNEPGSTRGGWPSGNEVYLIGPYYGMDSSFTDQYKKEAKAIATAIGDADGYTLYSGKAATVDKVAEAISKGAVVIFDSHGTTDYTDPNADLYDEYEDDYVTGANYSFLCLSTASGLTTQDYNDGAEYADGDAYVNGQVIANHMSTNSPGGFLWMAICLGMATDTICMPLREKGVEVVYGYSQSVTFDGDYLFESVFWDNMIAGKDVATSIAAMKTKWGNWDWSDQIADYYYSTYREAGYSTISQARRNYAAFPIVVSDEDAHPGQRNKSGFYGADSLQTVQSTYTLYSQYAITADSNNADWGTVSVRGSTVTAVPAQGYFTQGYTVLGGTATVTQSGNSFSVQAQSDCQLQIIFAPKTPVTVTFSGAEVESRDGYAGDPMALPSVTAPEGWEFLGWMTTPLGSDTTEKPEFYTNSFTPGSSVMLHALYSYVRQSADTVKDDYVKVTQSPADWSGEYVIVYEAGSRLFDGSMASYDSTSNYRSVTITGDTISAAQADAYRFIITAVEGGYSIRGASGNYIGRSTNANGLEVGTTPMVNTLSMDAAGNVHIIGEGGAYLRYNKTSGQERFRYYRSGTYSNQQPVALYLKNGTSFTTYYTTGITAQTGILSASITLGGVLGVSFKTNAPADHTMQITVGNAAPDNLTAQDGVFTVTVYAEDMLQPVEARLYNAQGGLVDQQTFTLESYVEAVEQMNDASEATKTLTAATLAYCRCAAKTQGKYSGEISGLQPVPEDAFEAFSFPAAGPEGVSAYANLREACGLYLRLPEQYSQGYTFLVDSREELLTKNGTTYVFGVQDILPQDYDRSHTFIIMQGDTEVYRCYLSVMGYLGECIRRELAQDGDMQALLTAMYAYYTAAEAYGQSL